MLQQLGKYDGKYGDGDEDEPQKVKVFFGRELMEEDSPGVHPRVQVFNPFH